MKLQKLFSRSALLNTLYLLLVCVSLATCSRYDNITETGVLETLVEDITDLRDSLDTRLDDLAERVDKELETLKDRLDDLYADIKHENWHLGMNLNPADGHIMAYETGWHTGQAIGSLSSAFTKDYLSTRVWNQPANYIAIARHQAGVLDAVKVWEFATPGLSLLERFKAMNPGRIIATSGGPVQIFIAGNARNLKNDPIFSVDGDVALNWGYSDNGCRVALTGGHLSAASVNDDNTHGLGNNFAIDPKTAKVTSDQHWEHEISNIQNCPLLSCKTVQLQGTDHGSGPHLISGPVYGNYAIYVSVAASRFPTLRKSLATEMDQSIISK